MSILKKIKKKIENIERNIAVEYLRKQYVNANRYMEKHSDESTIETMKTEELVKRAAKAYEFAKYTSFSSDGFLTEVGVCTICDITGDVIFRKKRLEYDGNDISNVVSMDRQEVQTMVCQAINNIPECAEIRDCYVEHSFCDSEAWIKVHVEVKEKTEDNIVTFHDAAHYAFGTEMGMIG